MQQLGFTNFDFGIGAKTAAFGELYNDALHEGVQKYQAQNTTDQQGHWEYSQSTGQMVHVLSDGTEQLVGTGYSGQGEGLNNSMAQDKPDIGPIPQGEYNIGPGHHSRNTGPNTMNLTPRDGTDTFGRDLFRIHGDNAMHDASHGCIILSPRVRTQINDSYDRFLQVTP